MPYSMDKLPPSAEKLTDAQKKKFIGICNAMLKQPGMDEGIAIATALKKAQEFSDEEFEEFIAAENKFGFGSKSAQHSENEFFEGKWVEVFRAGKQTDSDGNTKTWTEEDLKTIENNYNTQKEHEAPLVVGHPKENAPAFGWVEELKANGKTLLAKFKQVMPEFADAVKEGRYKKRSISLYDNLTLRHIGFLGAIPPAVKGLADIAFNEDDKFVTVEFNQEEKSSNININLQKGEKQMDEKITKLEAQIAAFNESLVSLQGKNAELESKNSELSEKLSKTGSSEFQESADSRIKEMETKLAIAEKANRTSNYREFVKDLHSQGKMVTECQNMVIDLMEAIHDKGVANFSEGEASILDTFKSYLEKQPKMVDFSETNTDNAKKNATKSADTQLVELAMAKIKESNISYNEALSQVQVENPELAAQACNEI